MVSCQFGHWSKGHSGITKLHLLPEILAEQNETVSHGVVLQKRSKGVEWKVVLDTDNADDMAISDNSRDGLQESTNPLANYSFYAAPWVNAGRPCAWP